MNKWLISLLLFLSILTLLPQIASSTFGKKLTQKIIERKVGGDVEIGSLKFSWFGPQVFRDVDWSHNTIHGNIKELQIEAPFWKIKGPFYLKKATILYPGGKIDQIEGKIQGNDFDLEGIALEGGFSLKGKIYSKSHFDVNIDIQELPLILFGKTTSEFFGPIVNISGNIQAIKGEGKLDLCLSSPTLQSQISANFDRTNFSLRETLHLTLESSTFEKAEFIIHPQNFFFPIPFDLKKIKIKNAHINLGKTHYKLKKSFDFLEFAKISAQHELSIWFAPFNASFEQGVLSLERIDFLINQDLHLFTWGEIHFPSEKLNLSIGLPKEFLEKSFKIPNLPLGYALKVNVDGTLDEPEFATKKLSANIGALIATNKIPKNKILKGLANAIKTPKVDEKIPQPKSPYPWECQ